MGRPDDVARLLNAGLDPVAMARELQITLASVLGYLDRAIFEGLIRRSDIYFSISPEEREDPSRDYKTILDRYRNGAAAYGDMYEDLRNIELSLHRRVREELESALGASELEWFLDVLPEGVRLKCVEGREKDRYNYLEPYCYTDLLDLSKIIAKKWTLFEDILPAPIGSDKPRFTNDMETLNKLRNRVMHPVRGPAPNESDFEFVRDVKSRLGPWASPE